MFSFLNEALRIGSFDKAMGQLGKNCTPPNPHEPLGLHCHSLYLSVFTLLVAGSPGEKAGRGQPAVDAQ